MCLAGGTLENTCNFELRTDLETAILEISAEGSKTMKDAEPTSLRALLQELEESGIVDATVCCHQVSRVSPTLDSDETEGTESCDGYMVKPKEKKVTLQWTAMSGNLKSSNVASCFPND
ncbi:unnamed protein product [Cladocopium goreaui]|uniref:Uncharacterized protein n=1 Tax=Cladocopium goreaui TaxID=2562237 RepID=A0A9P1GU21_9DINO|nr:unnamed protein product [Cladocopium goreaui]